LLLPSPHVLDRYFLNPDLTSILDFFLIIPSPKKLSSREGDDTLSGRKFLELGAFIQWRKANFEVSKWNREDFDPRIQRLSAPRIKAQDIQAGHSGIDIFLHFNQVPRIDTSPIFP
jgi:hypothetical protein